MSGSRNDDIFTVVSRPGPVERAILDRLAPSVEVHRRVGAGVSLRTLEGGSGSTIVFVHGRGHAATIWAPLLARFVEDHRVVAIDLPGFGHSGAPPCDVDGAEEGLRYFVTPLEAWLASLATPVTIVGHSLGGLVALALALGGRVPVRALALVDAMGLGGTVSAASRLYLRANPERLARLRGALPRSTRSRSELEGLRLELLGVRGGRPRASRAFDAMVPLVGPAFHLGARLSEIDVPTLLLWGEHDEAFPLSVAESAVSRFSRGQLVTLDAAHSPHVTDPHAVGDALAAWLAAVGA